MTIFTASAQFEQKLRNLIMQSGLDLNTTYYILHCVDLEVANAKEKQSYEDQLNELKNNSEVTEEPSNKEVGQE